MKNNQSSINNYQNWGYKMANMCNNVINITGNKKDLLKFKMDFKGTLHEGKLHF